jgi:hypothetical protein
MQSIHLFFQPRCHAQKALDLGTVPRYRFREPAVAGRLGDALWRITPLSAETLFMLFATVLAFRWYDVR